MTAGTRREWGSGGLYERNGKWVFQRSFMVYERGKMRRVRRTVTAETPEEAQRLGALLVPSPNPKRRRRPNWAWVEKHKNDHVTAKERKARSIASICRILDEARGDDWTDEYLAAVLLAQLTPTRVRRGIFGPCAYCGTWLASNIDHVIPIARGGPDTADNVVSACQSCNFSKGDKLLSEWRPRGNMADDLAV